MDLSIPPEIQAVLDEAGIVGMDVMYLDDMVKQGREKNLVDCGVSEIYSIPRVAQRAEAYDLVQGWSLDILTGWDFNNNQAQKFVVYACISSVNAFASL